MSQPAPVAAPTDPPAGTARRARRCRARNISRRCRTRWWGWSWVILGRACWRECRPRSARRGRRQTFGSRSGKTRCAFGRSRGFGRLPGPAANAAGHAAQREDANARRCSVFIARAPFWHKTDHTTSPSRCRAINSAVGGCRTGRVSRRPSNFRNVSRNAACAWCSFKVGLSTIRPSSSKLSKC